MSLSVRLTFILSPFLIWGALYLASRLSGISPIRFTPWIGIVGLFLFCVSVGLFIFDRLHIANALALDGWALYGAQLWIKHHYKGDPANQDHAMTSLKL